MCVSNCLPVNLICMLFAAAVRKYAGGNEMYMILIARHLSLWNLQDLES